MSTLEEDLNAERRHLRELRVRAERRLTECQEEAEALLSQGHSTAADGDTTGAAGFERRVQKLRGRASRYEDLLRELDTGGDRLVGEILLARLQGPESDLLAGEAERNREVIVQRATNLLRSRDRHRALRRRWVELNDKIRALPQQPVAGSS